MGFQEILIIILAAIVILKPSEIPSFLYKCGKLLQQFRKLGNSIHGTLNEVLSEGELDEIKSMARKKAMAIDPVSIPSKKRLKK